MKNIKALFVLVVVGSALATYFLVYQREAKQAAIQAKASILLPVQAEAVTSVIIESPGRRLEVTKKDGAWQLVDPVNSPADEVEVLQLIKSLVTEKSLDIVSDDADFKWSVYGLDRPEGRVTLKTQAGASPTLHIGRRKAYSGDLYVRLDNEKKVWLVGSVWSTYLKKDPAILRDKRIFKNDIAAISEIRIKNIKDGVRNNFHLVRDIKAGRWYLEEDRQALIADGEVESFLNHVHDLKAIRFSSESHGQDELKKFDLTAKEISQIELVAQQANGSKITHSITLSPANKQGQVFLTTSDLAPIVEVPRAGAEPLRVDMFDFHDKTSPFAFATENVESLEYHSQQITTRWIKKQGQWKFKDSDKMVASNQVETWLRTLRDLRVKKYLGAAQKGGASFENQLDLRDGKGQLLISFRWGVAQRKPAAQDKKDKSETIILATTNLSGQTLGLEPESLQNFQGLTQIRDR